MAPKKRPSVTRQAAEALAIQALSFIAADPERLGGFLAASGIGPDRIRAAAREQYFLAAVLDHIVAEQALLATFAAELSIEPAEVARARAALAGQSWERDVP